jgi:hypothetical protein
MGGKINNGLGLGVVPAQVLPVATQQRYSTRGPKASSRSRHSAPAINNSRSCQGRVEGCVKGGVVSCTSERIDRVGFIERTTAAGRG